MIMYIYIYMYTSELSCHPARGKQLVAKTAVENWLVAMHWMNSTSLLCWSIARKGIAVGNGVPAGLWAEHFQWSVISNQWSVVSDQWSVVSDQWSAVSGQWARQFCRKSIPRAHKPASLHQEFLYWYNI